MSLHVRFWGTRGSVPTPGRSTRHYGGNTTCVEIRRGDSVFLCDAGTGIRNAGDELVRRGLDGVGLHILFSHTHWDHIQGFPFFAPAYEAGRTVHLWAVPGWGERVERLLSEQMQEEYFPVAFTQLGAAIETAELPADPVEIGGVVVGHHPVPHPGGCSAFSFSADGHKVVYMTDAEIDALLDDVDATFADPDAPRSLPASLVEFVRGADLLIGDGQYTDATYAAHQGWGHPRITTMVDLAIAAGVGQLAVTHHDPSESDPEVEHKLRRARERATRVGANLSVFGAREDLQLELG